MSRAPCSCLAVLKNREEEEEEEKQKNTRNRRCELLFFSWIRQATAAAASCYYTRAGRVVHFTL